MTYFHGCLLAHCNVCGNHYENPGQYCHACMEERWELVRKDAEVRGLLGRPSESTIGCSHRDEGDTQ